MNQVTLAPSPLRIPERPVPFPTVTLLDLQQQLLTPAFREQVVNSSRRRNSEATREAFRRQL